MRFAITQRTLSIASWMKSPNLALFRHSRKLARAQPRTSPWCRLRHTSRSLLVSPLSSLWPNRRKGATIGFD